MEWKQLQANYEHQHELIREAEKERLLAQVTRPFTLHMLIQRLRGM